MSGSTQCPHSNVAWHHHINGFSDSNVASVVLTAKCNICGKRMKLDRGLPMGASSQGPTQAGDDTLGIMFPMIAEGEEPSKEWGFVVTRVT
jgi:hypothetical protein